jgi:hypothetical protein
MLVTYSIKLRFHTYETESCIFENKESVWDFENGQKYLSKKEKSQKKSCKKIHDFQFTA